MKIKHLLALFGLALLAHTAAADITLHRFSDTPVQSCGSFAGRWDGIGTIKAKIIIPITCHYHGTADVIANANIPNAFTVHVDFTKSDGVCPDHETIDLPGTCDNGNLHLQTDQADLKGNINDAGTEAKLNGVVTFQVAGRNINADVEDLILRKQ